MPRYNYKCNSCGEEQEIMHSMKEKVELCELCGAEEMERIPSVLRSVKTETVNRAGSIVDSFIENAKKEVEQEKENLKQREFK